ncbi:MAG: primosomal protein N' [Candidatus Omnitrophota bacterium]|nr:primosomal protein N' [Candidatus Omnitrophota bacterium]
MRDLLVASGEIVDVAVPLPVQGLFSYFVPPELEEKIKIGVRVRVPFRNREIVGYIVGTREYDDSLALKPVADILDGEPVLSEGMLSLTKWIGEYYGASWGESIENALPKWVKFGKKAARAIRREEAREVEPDEVEHRPDVRLTADQEKSLKAIIAGLDHERPKPILLYGVTGSGKSEVYIRSIREVLRRNEAAICLVPEIALTEQLRRFFLHHFGGELEILHSKLSDGERFVAWKRLESGSRRVVLGPRSAVFSPVPKLGLIIIDEEHEGSYKQETAPRYHAREVAAWRAAQAGALLVMGTATPSLETMYRAERGEVTKIHLETRIGEKPMPDVQIIDLKEAFAGYKKSGILSPPLGYAIERNLKEKHGTMLLLNRRGFSTRVHCPKCGTAENCPSCEISLVHHQAEDMLLCHYCNFRKIVASGCSTCGAAMMRFAGFGTEKVESEVARRFPEARVARLDTDTARRKGAHEEILGAFRRREIDILIGTQMIAKGFDFPHVTLVGVILADVGLMLPDFRSAERTFQLLTQVAGRAGRGELPGKVYIQTYSPGHPSVRYAKEHDFSSFYLYELPSRKEHAYPPYRQLTNIIIRSRDEKKTYQFSREVRDALREELVSDDHATAGVEVVGPAPLPFAKLRGHYRWHVMIKAPYGAGLIERITKRLASVRKSAAVSYAVDVDPLNIL